MSSQYRCILTIILLMIGGCAIKYPDTTNYNSSTDSNDEAVLTILPVADHRIDESLVIELVDPGKAWPQDAYKDIKQFYWYMNKILANRKGYKLRLAENRDLVNNLNRDDFEEEPEKLNLGPSDAKRVLLLTLDDLAVQEALLGIAVQAECTGYIFDNTTGNISSKIKGRSKQNRGGLSGKLDAPDLPRNTVSLCFINIYEKMPSLL